jgi:hypothetical protein
MRTGVSANAAERIPCDSGWMVEVMPLGPPASHAVAGHQSGHAGRAWRRHSSPNFHHVLAAASQKHWPQAAAPATAGIQTVAQHVPLAVPRVAGHYQSVSAIPAQSNAALQQAINLENVPQSWRPALQFIMVQESTGKVGASSPVHSARGLYQLTAANYHFNPNGVHSFGNAVEEAQGGIRYIRQRYGTADNAAAFWQQHGWY